MQGSETELEMLLLSKVQAHQRDWKEGTGNRQNVAVVLGEKLERNERIIDRKGIDREIKKERKKERERGSTREKETESKRR